jgi:hypothetical protein
MSPEALPEFASRDGASIETVTCQARKTRANGGEKRSDLNREKMVSPAHGEGNLTFFQYSANECCASNGGICFGPGAVEEKHLNLHIAKESDRSSHTGGKRLEVILT